MGLYIESEKCVLIPDLHGAYRHLEQVAYHYDDQNPTYIALGDVINGEAANDSDSRQTLDHLRDIGALQLHGNHELALLGGLLPYNPEVREIWATLFSGRYQAFSHHEMTRHYEAHSLVNDYDSVQKLGRALRDLGHLSLLTGASMYVEHPQFIAVHAGLTDQPLPEQKQQLDDYDIQLHREHWPDDFDIPVQCFDQTLAEQAEAFAVTDKTVVTGHRHLQLPPEGRLTDGGKRVRLASNIKTPRSPLFVWESWTGQITAFDSQRRLT